MNATERRELRRIINDRFEQLRLECEKRENEIAQLVRKRIYEESAEQLTDFRQRFADLIAEAHAAGLELDERNSYVRGKYQLAGISVEPAGVDGRIKQELIRLKVDREMGQIRLGQLRLQLQEEILLGAIESDDAKAFLARVPTVDALMPSPEALKELQA